MNVFEPHIIIKIIIYYSNNEVLKIYAKKHQNNYKNKIQNV